MGYKEQRNIYTSPEKGRRTTWSHSSNLLIGSLANLSVGDTPRAQGRQVAKAWGNQVLRTWIQS